MKKLFAAVAQTVRRVFRRKPLVAETKGVAHQRGYRAIKDENDVARLRAGGNPRNNLRVLERAGAMPASAFIKADRKNAHVHPRSKRNSA